MRLSSLYKSRNPDLESASLDGISLGLAGKNRNKLLLFTIGNANNKSNTERQSIFLESNRTRTEFHYQMTWHLFFRSHFDWLSNSDLSMHSFCWIMALEWVSERMLVIGLAVHLPRLFWSDKSKLDLLSLWPCWWRWSTKARNHRPIRAKYPATSRTFKVWSFSSSPTLPSRTSLAWSM